MSRKNSAGSAVLLDEFRQHRHFIKSNHPFGKQQKAHYDTDTLIRQLRTSPKSELYFDGIQRLLREERIKRNEFSRVITLTDSSIRVTLLGHAHPAGEDGTLSTAVDSLITALHIVNTALVTIE